jgi:hypothetical protein
MMLLVFYTVYLLGLDERGPGASSPSPSRLTPPTEMVAPLLRVLSSLHKSYVCEHTVPALFACMEALGGVGYLVNSESEHINVARLFRDACVGAIWEGTTDVLAGDTVRAVKHPKGGEKSVEAVDWVVKEGLKVSGEGKGAAWEAAREGISKRWEGVKERIRKEKPEDLLPEARTVTFQMAEVLIGVLMRVDVAADPGAEIEEMVGRFMVKKGFVTEEERGRTGGALEMDYGIVYGRRRAGDLIGKL